MSKKIVLTIFILILVGLAAVILRPSEKLVLFDNLEENQRFSQNSDSQIFPSPTPNLVETPSLNESVNIKEEEENLEKQITLMFVGDIMLSRAVGEKMEKENDWKWPFLKIADTLKETDVLFGNLEGPISDKGQNIGSIYSFRADPRAIEGLNFAGFDILSVANNHILDWGRDAMEDNFKRLKEAGISYVGGGFNEAEAHAPIIKEIKGIKIAFLAYCGEGSEYWGAEGDRSGIAWLTEEKIKENIVQAKTQADLIVVSMHFGEEYKAQPNSSQKFFAHLAIDSGADLVIGHHSHILQLPIEEYKNGYIAYSLGNFVFDQTFSPQTKESMILKVVVEVPSTSSGQDGKIKVVIPLKVEISNDFQVFLK